jgi:hypothetical protein
MSFTVARNWGSFTGSQLPNKLGATVQSAALQVGDTAYNTSSGQLMVCTSAGLGTATYGGGGGAQTTFVYRPGAIGPTAPIYSSWATLYADYILTDGPVSIEIDDSITSPAVIPAGAYTFRHDTVLSGNFTDVESVGSFCNLADGVTFVGLTHVDNALNLRSLSSAPIITATGPTFLTLSKGSLLTALGTAPFIFNNLENTTGFVYIALFSGSKLATATDRIVRLEDPLLVGPAVLILAIYDEGDVQSDTIESGGGNVQITPRLLGDSGQFSYNQPNYTTTNPTNSSFVQATRNYWILTFQEEDYTALVGELVRCDPVSVGPFKVTLPPADEVPPGAWIVVKNITDSSNSITIDPTGADTIDGVSSPGAFVIAAARGVATFVSDGVSEWMVLI